MCECNILFQCYHTAVLYHEDADTAGPGKDFPRDTGYKNILKKSVYFTNSRFRDILLDITILSEHNTISNWVDNLDDIKYLMKNISPSVLECFEAAFVETNYCKQTNHASLTEG